MDEPAEGSGFRDGNAMYPSPTQQTLGSRGIVELPLPEGLKKSSKGNFIQDEHFEETRNLWKARDAYHKGLGPDEACLSERPWIILSEEIKACGYDLTSRNPNRRETETLSSPMEIVAGLLKKEAGIEYRGGAG